MKVLVENRFVTKRKDGNKMMYKLNHGMMDGISGHLQLTNAAHADCACKTMKKGVC